MSAVFHQPLYAAAVYLAGFLLINLFVPAAAVEYHRISTLTASLATLLFGLLSCLSFNKGVAGFQFSGDMGTI
jgi:hypothetical protein